MQSKVCSTCRQEKPVSEFFEGNRYKDGYRGQCKDCTIKKSKEYSNTDKGIKIKRESVRKWRASHIEERKAYVKQYLEGKGKDYFHNYYQTERGKQVRNDAVKRYRKTDKGKQNEINYTKRNPEKRQAKGAVSLAIKHGIIPHIKTQLCKECGKQAEQYHHWSYLPEHRLDVVPLCRKCHAGIHQAKQ